MTRILTSCLAVALLAPVCFAQDTPAIRKAPELGFHLPGEGEQLLSQYQGKVVALEFILTTCMHCQAASHVMTRLQQEYGGRGFQALDLAINALDQNRTPQEADTLVQTFTRTFQVGFPVGWIARDQFLSFMGFSVAEYLVVPQLVLIDRKGNIHYQTPARGAENDTKEETIRQRIEELLALHDAPAARAHAAAKKRT